MAFSWLDGPAQICREIEHEQNAQEIMTSGQVFNFGQVSGEFDVEEEQQEAPLCSPRLSFCDISDKKDLDTLWATLCYWIAQLTLVRATGPIGRQHCAKDQSSDQERVCSSIVRPTGWAEPLAPHPTR